MLPSGHGGGPVSIPWLPELEGYISFRFLNNQAKLAGLVWYLHDYLLTLPLEISTMWGGKINLLVILYFTNRYIFLVSWVIQCVLGFGMIRSEKESCTILNCTANLTGILVFIAKTSICTLRTYAISGWNRVVPLTLIPVVLTGIGLLIRDLINAFKGMGIILIPNSLDGIGTCTSMIPSPGNCTGGYCFWQYNSIVTLAIEDILNLLFVGTITAYTLSRTWRMSYQARDAGIKNGLNELLLRDGSLYFAALSIPILVHVIIVWVDTTRPVIYLLLNLIEPLVSIVNNRLCLNLRSHVQSNNKHLISKSDMFFRTVYVHMESDTTTTTATSSGTDAPSKTVHTTLLGDFNEPLRVGDWREEEDADKSSLEGGAFAADRSRRSMRIPLAKPHLVDVNAPNDHVGIAIPPRIFFV